MVNHDFDTSITTRVAHRPWPMPGRPWVMTQTWHDLLFAHWRVDAARLRARIPPWLELDVFGGDAWLGIVPFLMTNVAPRGVPSLPWLSAFPELNVRTYVRAGGKPGVYFFSLDAGSALAVRAARTLLNLPYYSATMRVTQRDERIAYGSTRKSDGPAAFEAVYGPTGAAFTAVPGTLEYFLTERYCLYHYDRAGKPYRVDIHHPPWPLRPAAATIMTNTMSTASGLVLDDTPPLL